MYTIYDRVETTLRELKFPPLQGGPTKDDIIGLLEAVLDDYNEPEESEQVQELRQDIDDLYDGINQAIYELEDLEDIDKLNGIIEDLRRL